LLTGIHRINVYNHKHGKVINDFFAGPNKGMKIIMHFNTPINCFHYGIQFMYAQHT